MDKERPAPDAGPFGMALFLVSLSILFASSLVGYVWVRAASPAWPPPGTPPLPASLWLSTAVLLASSGTLHAALRGAQRGDRGALRRGMFATTALGLAFLGLQVAAWQPLLSTEGRPPRNLYAFTFYTLTGLHAAHVVGGIVGLVVVTVRALRGAYTPDDTMGVKLCAMYWHFLDVVWLVLFAVLKLT